MEVFVGALDEFVSVIKAAMHLICAGDANLLPDFPVSTETRINGGGVECFSMFSFAIGIVLSRRLPHDYTIKRLPKPLLVLEIFLLPIIL
jgi:hypothetical protein